MSGCSGPRVGGFGKERMTNENSASNEQTQAGARPNEQLLRYLRLGQSNRGLQERHSHLEEASNLIEGTDFP